MFKVYNTYHRKLNSIIFYRGTKKTNEVEEFFGAGPHTQSQRQVHFVENAAQRNKIVTSKGVIIYINIH